MEQLLWCVAGAVAGMIVGTLIVWIYNFYRRDSGWR